MDNRHYKRVGSSFSVYPDSLQSVSSNSDNIQQLTRIKHHLLKKIAIPFAAVSTAIITTISTASITYAQPVNYGNRIIKGLKENPEAKAKLSTLNPFSGMEETFNKVMAWIAEIPSNIAQFSINLMSELYELCAALILKTPLWIFDNEWFHNTTMYFSTIAIGIVSVLTTIEGIKHMLLGFKWSKIKNPMPLKKIIKRWIIASGILTISPWLFQKAFQGLNFLSEKIISLNASTMQTLALSADLKIFDVLTLIVFDAILIATIIPVLWKNGRRFFDIMVLGVTTPFAMTAWIFDSYRHLFNQWWNNLKRLSLVQLYYALFLLIIGWFIFAVPTPDSDTGMIIKLLIVIGSFARMQNPPNIISKHLDNGGGFDRVWSGSNKAGKDLKKRYSKTKKYVNNIVNLYKKSKGVPTVK